MLIRLRNTRSLQRRSLATVATSSTGATTGLQPTDPLELYRAKVALGQVKYDPLQVRALMEIRKLHAALLDYQPPIRLLTLLESLRPSTDPGVGKIPAWPFKRSALSELGMEMLPEEVKEREEILGMSDQARSKALVQVLKGEQGLESLNTPRGFLLTGEPGTGKSLIMDIFFESLPIPHKVRFHYHHFLLSIYSKVHDALEIQRLENEAEEKAMNALGGTEGYSWSRRDEMKALAITKGWKAVFAGGRSPNDPDLNTKEFVLASIARELIKTHGFLLAFDEVQLVDIAGAGLINRVLSWYWRLGGVVVGTSNRVPADLYNQGVQRDSIDDFLNALASRSPVVELRSSTDYRLIQRSTESESTSLPPGDFGEIEAWKRWGPGARGWFVKGEEMEFDEAVLRLTGGLEGTPTSLLVYGRQLEVPWHLNGVARFSFHDLCEKALGPADFITLGSRFHTIIVDNVPVLLLNAKNEARRLITMLDSFYETKTRLLVSAEVGIDTLFFPDAVSGARLPPAGFSVDDFNGSPDDIVTSNGSDHPFSAERIYEKDSYERDSASVPSNSVFSNRGPKELPVDPQGENGDSLTGEFAGDNILDLAQPWRPSAKQNVRQYIPIDPSAEIGDTLLGMDQVSQAGAYDPSAAGTAGDSLTEEMMGDMIQDLEQPYRPNVSSYAGEVDEQPKVVKKPRAKRPAPHPSAATPSFASLAIFTGEEERFAYKRAVSRVHEMSSGEFLRTATWSPLSPSLRTWERAVKSAPRVHVVPPPSRSFMGSKVPLSSEKLSGALAPADMRLLYPEGIPVADKQYEVKRESKSNKGKKIDIDNDDRRDFSPPVIKSEVHSWGLQSWGKGAGKWGQGTAAYEKDGVKGEEKK